MSAPQPPEAAVEAALAVSPVIWWKTSMHTPQGRLEQLVTDMKADEAASRQLVERQLAAALPHLRRAIIAELIEKLESELPDSDDWVSSTPAGILRGRQKWAIHWLRAELAEAGNGK